MPHVSIIVPAKESYEFIDECINSIASINTKIEILIGIDNCHATLSHILSRHIYSNTRCFFFNKPCGTYVIKNSLSICAKYENIIFFDSDDIMMPNLIDDTEEALKIHSVIGYKFIEFNNGSNPYESKKENNYITEGVIGIRKNVFLSLNGFEDWQCAADTEFMDRVKRNGISNSHIPHPSFYRRIHNNNLSSDKNNEMRKKYGEVIDERRMNYTMQKGEMITTEYVIIPTS